MNNSSFLSLDGKALAAVLQNEHRFYLDLILNENKTQRPKLCVILVGALAASTTYVQAKKVACEKVGVEAEIIHLEASCSEKEIIQTIEKLNKDPSIHGILVQLPLPSCINSVSVLETIDPLKDVDGLHSVNAGRLVTGDKRAMIPCTPKGIVKLLKHYNIQTSTKHVVIIGRSSIVGRPLSILMSHSHWKGDSTVTLVHSKSQKIIDHTRQADILICAAGQCQFITKEFIKPGACVVDVGIHRLESGKLCGDVEAQSAQEIAGALSPVPGGVGPMTVAMVVENVLIAWARRNYFKEPS